MSEKLTSTVWGIAPWSDDLLKTSGDIDRGRAGPDDYQAQLAKDFDSYHKLLQEAAITYHSGDFAGGTNDYFRNIVGESDGFEQGIEEAPVTRWFDTNTFYRQPTIAGRAGSRQPESYDYQAALLESPDDPAIYQPTLISPYTFAKLAKKDESVSEQAGQFFIEELYDQLLDEAAKQNVKALLLHEPYAAYHQVPEPEQQKLKQLITNLVNNHPELDIGVYFSFGDGSKLIGRLASIDGLAAIGCDLQKTSLDDIPSLPEHRFLAGLIDGGNTFRQPDEKLALSLEELSDKISPAEISLTHTVDLEYVPRVHALEKIRQIGRVVELTKGGENE